MRILLVAPNLSRRMGGEALKALQICEGLTARGHDVLQVTHARVRAELARDYPHFNIAYLEDGWVQAALAKLHLQFLLSLLNAWQLARLARRLVPDFEPDLVHVTSPISPVLPLFDLGHPHVVLGPINGNIAYPSAFARREPRRARWARHMLPWIQGLFGLLDRQKRRATILISGGERTKVALAYAGVQRDGMIDTLDAGIAPRLFDLHRLPAAIRNARFVFVGRLVDYKGCDLAIQALALTPPEVTLDIMGDGAERAALGMLAASLGVAARVQFLGWQTPDDDYYRRLQAYRALVLPTLAEANGIVFQEAMVLGLPVIAVDWGGAAQLLDGDTAVLIAPTSADAVVDGLAAAMARVAEDGNEAVRLAVSARRRAEDAGFAWPRLLAAWESVYEEVRSSGERRLPRPSTAPREM